MSNFVRRENVYGTRKVVFALAVALGLTLVGCGSEEQAQKDTTGADKSTQKVSVQTDQEGRHFEISIKTTKEEKDASQDLTPIVGEVTNAPVPFAGSDGKTHLDYELDATNFSGGKTTIEKLEVLDADSGDVVATLDTKEVASRLQPAGLRDSTKSLAPSMIANVFLDLTFGEAGDVPDRLLHRLSIKAEASPPGHQQITEEVGPTDVDRRALAVIGPPLKGSNFLAADSCCDSTLHRRATLPINGRISLAQRYAVDWEQLDADDRIYSGKKKVENYTIYGQKALAAADATVVKVVDGLPEQKPGVFPEGISPEEADGNSVILDIGGGNYALYAHFQPGSIRVKQGDRVERGDVLALVGNSGNSLAPHLHFHVMSGPLSLASNGLPYVIDSYTVTGQSAGTDAFDKAEQEGTRLALTPVDPAEKITNAMPLDQRVVDFD
jgi:murein DD-endopeptidase MepM/ murein hydrolase activator NlpD